MKKRKVCNILVFCNSGSLQCGIAKNSQLSKAIGHFSVLARFGYLRCITGLLYDLHLCFNFTGIIVTTTVVRFGHLSDHNSLK